MIYVQHRNKFMILTYFRANSNYIDIYWKKATVTNSCCQRKRRPTAWFVNFDVYREQRSSLLVLLTGNDVPPSFVFLKGNGVP